MISLTQAERDKFAEFLEQEAKSAEGILAQMEKVPVPEVLKRRYRAEALAQAVVAKMLRATETMDVR